MAVWTSLKWEAEFTHRRLVEQRKALAISALLALGRGDQVRARAATLRAAYPHRLLTPVIDSP